MQPCRVNFHTLGCKLNFSETSTLARQFVEGGFVRVAPTAEADICVINSCSVTEHADKKCRNLIRRLHRRNPQAIIAVTGCYAQLAPQRIAAIEGVDLVLGNNDKGDLYRRVAELAGKGPAQVYSCATEELTRFFAAFSTGDRTRAFLKVQDGCDYCCAYCTIHYARGASRNMPVADLEAKFAKKHWLKTFNANLQFSQAYVSPNWYQGGNNNLNALLNLYYNVKLNPAFHPKWLFENTLQYKLGMNNAPDDELRDYSISEDLFQWNMTVGYRSTKRWYYSLNTQFKTQILNNYKSNTTTLKAAFLSPGELNVGVGMTYNYANPKKTFTFDASISPFSYNMKTCLRKRMNVTSFGIEEGRKTVSEYGSSAEGKLTWKMCDNISLRSRMFVFTDYDYIQGDWENTIQFTINRFLSTQIFVHMRYDSTSPVIEDTDWHKFQLKEILSFGFTYKFNT